VSAEFISSDYLAVLGIKPVIGRLFREGEDEIGASPIVPDRRRILESQVWRLSGHPGTRTHPGRPDLHHRWCGPASFKLQVWSFRPSDVYAPIGQWTNPILPYRTAGLGFHGVGRLSRCGHSASASRHEARDRRLGCRVSGRRHGHRRNPDATQGTDGWLLAPASARSARGGWVCAPNCVRERGQPAYGRARRDEHANSRCAPRSVQTGEESCASC